MSHLNLSRQIEVCQNNANKGDNFSREFQVCQNNANKSDNFSRQIEVCQNNVNRSLKINWNNIYFILPKMVQYA